MLAISKLDIARHGPKDIVAVCLRQFLVERDLARRGIRFRDTDPAKVEAAYAAMTADEFDAVNGRQDWANWRTIPRALNGRVHDKPLRVVDLGCGTGGSTRVLAFWCPLGSHITGSDLTEPLLNVARRRDYRHQSGQPAQVDFVCHGATEPFRNVDGSQIAPGTVDVVHASGVVGHHLTPNTVTPLINELHRVLSANGVALLDVGPTLPGPVLRDIMADEGFTYYGHHRSWFGDATGEMVFTRPSKRATRRERVIVPHRHRRDVPPQPKQLRSRPKASGR
jgi:SAM-dependent methyltransferase